MTNDEMKRVLQHLGGAYSADITEAMVVAWRDDLAERDYPLAMQAARKLTADRNRWKMPTKGEFLAVYRSVEPTTVNDCGRCEGMRYVFVGSRDLNTVMPCPTCHAERHARWAAGEFRVRKSAEAEHHQAEPESVARVIAETRASLGGGR